MTKTKTRLDSPESAPRAALSAPQQDITIRTATVTDVHFLRLPHILKRLSISRSAWYDGISKGRFPRGIQLGARLTVWRSDQIDSVVAGICALQGVQS